MKNLKDVSRNEINSLTVCSLYKEAVLRNPNATAAIFRNDTLTYQELDNQSTLLANFLKNLGVNPQTIVGLCTDCDFYLLIGIFGILKAGGCYFPLDPNYPADRFNFMLEDANPHLVVTVSSFAHRFHQKPLVLIDKQDLSTHVKFVPPLIQSDTLAYLIYTSGSTGRPKGIMISHGSLLEASLARQSVYPSSMIGLVTGSICFDISMLTIFHSLVAGHTICLPGDTSLIDPDATIELIHKKSINYLLCVPFFYDMLLKRRKPLSTLQTVSLAGESVPQYLPVLHQQIAPNAILYNEYGPSECAMGATIAKIYDPTTQIIEPITIGKAHAHVQVHLLDQDCKPVPIGEKGEIFIASPSLATGYLNLPKLTAEKFFDVSLEKDQSQRMYRTGDYGCLLPNGNLKFLGRMDHQVKIRGYRIELEEVEHLIRQYNGIEEAVVVYQEQRLLAYYTAHNPLSEAFLKKYLSSKLPLQAIPSSFLKIDQFKRTPNGKIDRANLPLIPKTSTTNTEVDNACNDLERELLAIWKEVLGKENIALKDNFFDLGGDSLGLANIQASIEKNLKRNISVIDLIQYPNIKELAKHLSFENKNPSNPIEQLSGKKPDFTHFRQAKIRNSL